MGGKLGRFERDGFAFDTGPSLLTLPAVYRDLFLKTGAALEECVDLVAVDPVRHYRFADGTELDVPNSRPARVCARSTRPSGRRRGGLARFLAHAGEIWQVTRRPFLESPLDGPRDLLRQPVGSRDLRTVAPWRSLDASAGATCATRGCAVPRALRDLHRLRPAPRAGRARGRAVRRADVRRLVRRAAACGGSPTACTTRCVERGVDRPHRRRRHGVIEGDRRRVDGVRLADGEPSPADVVVSNADAAEVYGRPAAPRTSCRQGPRRRLRRRRRRCPASSCCSRCAAAPRACATTPCCSRPDYDAEFDAVFGRAARRRSPTRRSTSARPTTRRCARTTTTRRGSSWSTLRGTTRPRGGGLGRAGLADAYADRVLDVWPRAARRPRPGAVAGDRTPADLERATRAPAARSTARRPTARGRRSCGRPTPRRCRGCSWSAARRTPAAGCRWSACRPRSSPT